MTYEGIHRPFRERPDWWEEAAERLKPHVHLPETGVRFLGGEDVAAVYDRVGDASSIHTRLRAGLYATELGILPVDFSEVMVEQDQFLRILFADTTPLYDLRRYLVRDLIGRRKPIRFAFSMLLGAKRRNGDINEASAIANQFLGGQSTTLDWVHVADLSTAEQNPSGANDSEPETQASATLALPPAGNTLVPPQISPWEDIGGELGGELGKLIETRGGAWNAAKAARALGWPSDHADIGHTLAHFARRGLLRDIGGEKYKLPAPGSEPAGPSSEDTEE